MLTQTFIHAPGIGPKTEQFFWNNDVRNWRDYLDRAKRGHLCSGRLRALPAVINASVSALAKGDVDFFFGALPTTERWRLLSTFRHRIGYVDIETTGLFRGFDTITVIALSDGHQTQTFVAGRNLDKFPKVAARYRLLVTYGGASFDIPFINGAFGRFNPQAYVDLRYPLARLGLSGGLKEVERVIGMRRPRGIRELDGLDAALLWHRYQRGDHGALERLVEYARHDVLSLEPLADCVADLMPELLQLQRSDTEAEVGPRFHLQSIR